MRLAQWCNVCVCFVCEQKVRSTLMMPFVLSFFFLILWPFSEINWLFIIFYCLPFFTRYLWTTLFKWIWVIVKNLSYVKRKSFLPCSWGGIHNFLLYFYWWTFLLSFLFEFLNNLFEFWLSVFFLLFEIIFSETTVSFNNAQLSFFKIGFFRWNL